MKTLTELWAESPANPNKEINTPIGEVITRQREFNTTGRSIINREPRTTAAICTDDQIRRYAPSVFAARPYSETSSDYRFLPTIEVINALRAYGYNVTKAMQSRSRMVLRNQEGQVIESKRDFTKHMIRLRHNEYMSHFNVGDEVPEIVLVNSHDRSSGFKLMLGFFRLVCSNGMVVASSTIDSLNVRHIGSKDLLNEVLNVSTQVIAQAPKALEQINRFKAVELSDLHRFGFAQRAAALHSSSLEIKPERLLQVRRSHDRGSDLWKTLNVVQENLIRGGIWGHSKSGEMRHSREVKSIDTNISLNKSLWGIAEEMAQLRIV